MIPSALCNLDTLHVAAFISFNEDIFRQFVEFHSLLTTKREIFNRVYAGIHKQIAAYPNSELARLPSFQLAKIAEQRMKELRSQPLAMQTECVMQWQFNNRTWLVQQSGKDQCDLMLTSAGLILHVRIGKLSAHLANVHVEVGSLELWSNPWRETVNYILSTLNLLGGELRPHCISRVDVAFHCQGLGDLDPNNFVTRARKIRPIEKSKFFERLDRAIADGTYEEFRKEMEFKYEASRSTFISGREVQTIEFGDRSRLFARVYRKDIEIRHQREKKSAFPEIWKNAGFQLERIAPCTQEIQPVPVYNVEFQLMREYLRERRFWIRSKSFSGNRTSFNGTYISIDTLHDLLTYFEDLKVYLVGNDSTGGWLRLTDGDATRKHRAALDEAWQAIWRTVENEYRVSAATREKKGVAPRTKELVKRTGRFIAHMIARRRGHFFQPQSEYEARAAKEYCMRLLSDQIDMYNYFSERDGMPLFHEIVAQESCRLGILDDGLPVLEFSPTDSQES